MDSFKFPHSFQFLFFPLNIALKSHACVRFYSIWNKLLCQRKHFSLHWNFICSASAAISLTLTIYLGKTAMKTIKYFVCQIHVSDGHNSNLSCCIASKYIFFIVSPFSFGQKTKRERRWVEAKGKRVVKISSIMFIFRLYRLMSRFWCVLAHHFFSLLLEWWDLDGERKNWVRDWKNCQYFFFCMGRWTLNIVWNAYIFVVMRLAAAYIRLCEIV